jgi:hypothetical protein
MFKTIVWATDGSESAEGRLAELVDPGRPSTA